MPNVQRPEEAGEWLRHAADDLEAAELLLDAVLPKIRQALFAAQQATEKALKAFLIHHGQEYPLTHNLLLLANVCSKVDGSLRATVDAALPLTDFAVRFRYPGAAAEEVEMADARQWVAAARHVLAAVSTRICV